MAPAPGTVEGGSPQNEWLGALLSQRVDSVESHRWSMMQQHNEHIANLAAARDRLVEERRRLTTELDKPYERSRGHDTEDVRDAFVKVQAVIDAVERALAHEAHLQRPRDTDESAQGAGFYSLK